MTQGKLEEVGKRHGATRGRFFISPRAGQRGSQGGDNRQMTIHFLGGAEPPVDVLLATEEYLRETAEQIVRAVQDARAGRMGEIKAAQQSVRDLKTLFQMVMDERTRVEKLRKQVAGVLDRDGHDHALDFDWARDEIGSRLARLRDAGGG